MRIFNWLDHPERVSKRTIRNYNFFLLLLVIGSLIWAVVPLLSQTKVQVQQLKNVIVSPIAAVERFQCVGSGTNSNGTTWDCTGMQMIRLVLVDGTVLGPYVAIPATPQVSALSNWQTIPLATKP